MSKESAHGCFSVIIYIADMKKYYLSFKFLSRYCLKFFFVVSYYKRKLRKEITKWISR